MSEDWGEYFESLMGAGEASEFRRLMLDYRSHTSADPIGVKEAYEAVLNFLGKFVKDARWHCFVDQ